MFNHIKSRLLASIIPVVVLIILISYFLSGMTSRDIINNEINRKMASVQVEQKNSITGAVDNLVDIVTATSIFVENSYQNISSEDYDNILKEILEDKPEALGVGIWFEPYVFDSNIKNVGLYSYRKGDMIISTDFYNSEEYNYFSQPFYKGAKDELNTYFTEVYYDEETQYYMLSVSNPFFDKNGNYIGCVAVDFEVSKLEGIVEKYNSENEMFFVASSEGILLGSDKAEHVSEQKSVFDFGNNDEEPLSLEVLENSNGIIELNLNGTESIVYYDTIDNLGWKIIYVVPKSTVKAPIKMIVNMYMLIAICLVIIISGIIFFTVSIYIERPLNILVIEFEKITNNTYNTKVPDILLKYNDELRRLGKALGIMKTNLKQHHNDLEDLISENNTYSEEITKQNSLLVKSQENLKEAINYNQAIIKAIPELLFVVSKDGYCIDCQGNSYSHFMPKNYYINKHLSDLMPKEHCERVLELIKEVSDANDIKTYECNYLVGGINEYFDMRIADCLSDRVVIIARQVSTYHNNLKEIQYLSYHDQVTGLYNRRHYEETLVEIVKNDVFPLSVVNSDLNGLKLINDSFGHHEGDKLLKMFAKVLSNTDIDFKNIARIGGDEFFIFLPKTDEEEAHNIVSQIEDLCSKETVSGITLSVSFGVATMYSNDEAIVDIVKASEDIMYQNKLYRASSRKHNTIDVILRTLEEKNPREQLHSKRVSEICVKIAAGLGMSIAQQNKIEQAGLLHDIGKIGVPEYVLNKSEILTPDELSSIHKHPEIGYRILQSAGNMEEISAIILAHHERWDGNGYPRKLKGEEIPIESRIISIADTYDAITSERSYREGLSKEYAISEIKNCAGAQFDPEIVSVFIEKVVDLI